MSKRSNARMSLHHPGPHRMEGGAKAQHLKRISLLCPGRAFDIVHLAICADIPQGCCVIMRRAWLRFTEFSGRILAIVDEGEEEEEEGDF